MTTDTPQTLLKPSDAAKVLSVSPRTLARWTASGLLPNVRLTPQTIRYRQCDLDAFINQKIEQK